MCIVMMIRRQGIRWKRDLGSGSGTRWRVSHHGPRLQNATRFTEQAGRGQLAINDQSSAGKSTSYIKYIVTSHHSQSTMRVRSNRLFISRVLTYGPVGCGALCMEISATCKKRKGVSSSRPGISNIMIID